MSSVVKATKRRSKADALLHPGRRTEPSLKKRLLTAEIAAPELAGVRTLWQDAVAPGLTPQRLAAILHAAEQGNHRDYLTLAEEMEERELHYIAVLGTRKRAISGLLPTIEAAGEDARAVELADAVEDLVRQPVFGQLVEHLVDAIGKGYAVSEIMWGTSASRWMPYDYRARDPRFFVFDQVDRATLRLATLADPVFGEALPLNKFVRHVPRLKSGVPVRGGLAKPAAWAYVFKIYTLKDWVAFAEVYGMPIRIGKYGPQATPEDKRKLLAAVRNIGTDAAAILPDTMTVELAEAGGAKSGGGAGVFDKLTDYLDKQISKLVLGQTMTADSGSSLAQAEVHENVRHDILVSDTRQVEITINRDLIKPFIDLNYGPQKVYPRVVLPVPRPEDLKALSEVLTKVVPLGVRVREQEVRERLGFSEPDEGDAILTGEGLAAFAREQHLESEDEAEPVEPAEPIEADPAEDKPVAKRGKTKGKAANRRGAGKSRAGHRAADDICSCGVAHNASVHGRSGAGPDASGGVTPRVHPHDAAELDELTRIALEGWEPIADPMLAPIRSLVNEAKSYDHFIAGLPKALAAMDTDQFVKTLAASMAIARGLGSITPAQKG